MINQLAVTFARAAGIPFKVSPHVIRASAVTYLKQQGFQDGDIPDILHQKWFLLMTNPRTQIMRVKK